MRGPAPRLVRLDTEVEVLVVVNGNTDGLAGVSRSRPSCAAFKASDTTIDGSRHQGTKRLDAEGMVEWGRWR